MDSEIKLMTGLHGRIAGPSLTVKWVPSRKPVDDYHTYIHALQAIDDASRGDVYVAAIDGETVPSPKNIAVFGGLMGTAASVKGIAGIVLDGAMRDITDVEEAGLPCFAKSLTPFNVQTRAETAGYNCRICCGGVLVNPGDMIVGDRDGVVVIPIELVDFVVEEGRKITATEALEIQELKGGTSLLKVLEEHARI